MKGFNILDIEYKARIFLCHASDLPMNDKKGVLTPLS